MNNKPEIIITFPACMGGVSSFNYNIINNSQLIKNFYSKVILIKATEDKRPLFLDTFNVDEVILFNFSYKENQFYVRKRLNKLLGERQGAIVTDNSLTITAAKLFANPKTIFHLLHDYFYVNENIVLGDMIDIAIAHSSFFSDAVFAANPGLLRSRHFYIPYGVKQLSAIPIKNNQTLRLVFLGRLDEGKGVLLLHEIEQKLREKNIIVKWTIIGKGHLKEQLCKQWQQDTNVVFHSPDSTAEVYQLLYEQDIFVFPTTFEGTPVSILECSANAIVTITNDLPGGIRDIVTNDIGYLCEINNIVQFVNNIEILNNDRTLLARLQHNCYRLSTEKYDIDKNADNYFDIFLQYESLKRKKKNSIVKSSFLDKSFFSNSIVKLIRSIR